MIEFLISLIPVCLGIWAIHIIFQEDHMLGKLGDKLRGPRSPDDQPLTRREYWMKPLFDCPICQSSFWGVIGFFAIRFFFNVDLPIKQLIPFVFCLCGLNVIISKLVNKERVIVEE
jgi:hypothetical protein